MQSNIKVPIALKLLIQKNNELLRQMQIDLEDQVISANEEIMNIMGLDPRDGWRLDMSNMVYVKQQNAELPENNSDSTPVL